MYRASAAEVCICEDLATRNESTGRAYHLRERMLEHLRKLRCRLLPKWRYLRQSRVYPYGGLKLLNVARFEMRPLDEIVESTPPALVSNSLAGIERVLSLERDIVGPLKCPSIE